MAPKYQIGQKVVINPANVQSSSLRESELEPYVGQVGEVRDYYWIALDRGINVFYVYTVIVEHNKKEIVLHEDELDEFKDY